MDRKNVERSMFSDNPEWGNIEEEEEDEDEEHDNDEDVEKEKKEYYCVLCCRKLRSDKQWESHEQYSKRHKEKVADQLREANRVKAITGYQEEADEGECDDEDEELESDKDEAGVLEAMLSGHRNRKKIFSNELDFREYNDVKVSRKNRGGRTRRGGREEKEIEATKATDMTKRNDEGEEHKGHNDDAKELTSNPLPNSEKKDTNDDETVKGEDVKNKNRRRRKDTPSKSEVTPRNCEGEIHDVRDDEARESNSNPLPESETKGANEDEAVKGEENPCEDLKSKNRRRRKDKASKSEVTSRNCEGWREDEAASSSSSLPEFDDATGMVDENPWVEVKKRNRKNKENNVTLNLTSTERNEKEEIAINIWETPISQSCLIKSR